MGGQEWVIGGLYIIKNKQESSDSFMKRQKGFNEFNGCQVQYQGLQLHPSTLQTWYKIVHRIRNPIRNFSYIHGLNWTKCCIMWICTMSWSWISIATTHVQQGVCHTVALPFTLIKNYIKAKRRIVEIQIFYHAKI
jgi:hypothetical protein